MTKNKITITGDASDVTRMLKGIQTGFEGVEKSSDKMEDKVNKDMKNVESTFSKATKKMKASVKSFNNVLKAGATIFAVKGTFDAVKNIETQKLGYEILKKKNKELANVIDRTSEITGGLVSKFDMVGAANKALGFKIVKSGKQFEDMMRVAVKLSAITGDSVDKIMTDLTTGVARKSIPILDNMQIKIASMPDLYKAYAESIGVTANQLTEQQKTTAVLNESLRQMEENTANVTNEMVKNNTRISASYKLIATNLRTLADTGVGLLGDLAKASEKWGESLADIGFLDSVARLIVGYDDLDKQIKKVNKSLDEELKAMHDLSTLEFAWNYTKNQDFRNLKKMGKEFIQSWKKINDDIDLKKRTMVFTDKDAKELNDDYNRDLARQKAYLLKKKSLLDNYFNTINKRPKDFTNIDDYMDYIYKQNLLKQKYYTDKSLSLEEIKQLKLLKVSEKEIDENNKKLDKLKVEELRKRYLNNIEINNFINQQSRERIKIVGEEVIRLSESGQYKEAMALEIENIKRYYKDKIQLTKEKEKEIQKIKDKYSKKAQEDAEAVLMKKVDFEKAGGNILVGVSNDIFNRLTGASEDTLRMIAGRALAQAGSKVYADGIQRVWVGGGEMLDPLTSEVGAVQVGYGIAEIGAGLGMGYLGNKMATPSNAKAQTSQNNLNIEDKNKEKQREIDNNKKSEIVVYNYPSERKWIMELQEGNKKASKNTVERR